MIEGINKLHIIQLYGIDKSMLGKRLKDILKEEGVRSSRLSQEIGIDKGHMSKFLQGKAGLSVDRRASCVVTAGIGQREPVIPK